MSSDDVALESAAIYAQFAARCRAVGFEPDEQCLNQIASFCEHLDQYNQNVNLVSNSSLPVLLRDHVLDSVTLIPVMKKRCKSAPGSPLSLVDIGSGAGFPGMILAICMPALNVVLIESIGKKCAFLQDAVNRLGLDDRVIVLNERAENIAHVKDFRCTFDFATARAVGDMFLIAELAIPFLRSGGLLLAQRSSRQLENETTQVPRLVEKFGGKLIATDFPDAAVTEKSVGIMVIERVAKVPPGYPRNGANLGKG